MSRTIHYLRSIREDDPIEVATLVGHMIRDAVESRASDVHIEPWESTLVVRIRLNGVLSELVHLPLELMERISGRLKVMANLISYQTDLPQEGHVPASPELGGVELRISIFPTVRGEKIVVRLFDPANRSFDLAGLGFDELIYRGLVNVLARPSGMLLLTGPTGSGKTTAIYAALSHLIQRSGPTISISTVEDPVEFSLPMVSQAQINPHKDFTYPIALRSLMRQDPQVIVIGEIRDAETGAIAVQAGLTGHLVISTIHSGSTAGVFARLMHMEIEPFLLASSIIGVVGLRLMRRNCLECSAPYDPDLALVQMLSAEESERATFRRGEGCERCVQTGFSGRSVLAEMLPVDEVVRDAVLKKLPTRTLQEVAVAQGMRTLWRAGVARAVSGDTTFEEVVRVVGVDTL